MPGSRVLIVGSGDPRHLLSTLAPTDSSAEAESSEDASDLTLLDGGGDGRGEQENRTEDVGHQETLTMKRNNDHRDESANVKEENTACKRLRTENDVGQREIFLLEQNMETYCRQLLLHRIATHPDLDLDEKVEIFIDLFANIRVRPESGRVARSESGQLAKEVAERKGFLSGCWSLELLRQREIDEMERVFVRWSKGSSEQIQDWWKRRQRQLLGGRWEARGGVAEMDFHMKLVERGGAEVGKVEFLRWREEGLAYNLKEEGVEMEEVEREDNMTLVSRGKVGQLGYYGDIVTGPFICLGTRRKVEWSIQDQQKVGTQEKHAQMVRDRVESLVKRLEGLNSSTSSTQPGCLVKPLGLPGPAAGGLEGLARVGRGLDTVWVRDD